MRVVTIHEAKTNLSRLIEEAASGEGFIIAKAGKPLVKVVPVTATEKPPRRLGTLAGRYLIPDDFDDMGSQEEIDTMFNGG
ncbi:type II toxin-antitoxin system Phd/YefM family antitoxin [Niveispirillum irakense]|uniref:type II toxin-antitoxin system Phd/YefM family antitoxin n=1 Tax=Niveispirillum irakense TaxID=34011 RepID=UPI00040EC485|nr:type II toxin-antitoxin system prevent-host-death family antitoxin [Niveispirillum irakense]